VKWIKELLNNAIELPEEEKKNLVLRAKSGDKKAKELLLLSDVKIIYKFTCEVCSFMKNFEHLEDAFQFFVKLYFERLRSYDENAGTKLTTYIYQALLWGKGEYIRRNRSLFNTEKNRSEAIDLKILSIDECWQDSDDPLIELVTPDQFEDIIDKITYEEMKEKIFKELSKKDKKLALIVLRRLQGKTLKEIGEEIGCSKQRVQQILKENDSLLRRVCSKYL